MHWESMGKLPSARLLPCLPTACLIAHFIQSACVCGWTDGMNFLQIYNHHTPKVQKPDKYSYNSSPSTRQ